MEFELFTVAIKQDGTVKVHFNPELLQVATEEEIISHLSGKMEENLIPIAESIIEFVQSRG